jgi:hypothetical protein
MSLTTCPHCGNQTTWTWDEAFDKFGFGDGDSVVMTDHVAQALRQAGYIVDVAPWGIHNVTISSIKTKHGRELIPFDRIEFGYDSARDYLPKRIVELLDTTFTPDTEVEA